MKFTSVNSTCPSTRFCVFILQIMPTPGTYVCRLCKVVVPWKEQYIMHVNGRKHRRKIEQMQMEAEG